MPRNISFSMTTDQIRNRTKTVTRRKGWRFLKAGDVLNACVKCMGLKPGEKIERLCRIRVIDVRQEPLSRMTNELDYGFAETTLEGYPEGADKHSPDRFVAMFCRAMSCFPADEVTRIEFEYLEEIKPNPPDKEDIEAGEKRAWLRGCTRCNNVHNRLKGCPNCGNPEFEIVRVDC